MGCGCNETKVSNRTDQEPVKSIEMLGALGVQSIFEQGREALAEASRALEHLNRAERTKVLGFEASVAKMYHEAAKRSNQRAQEQIRTVLERIDARAKQEDWTATVARVRVAFKEHGGAAKFANLREDMRMHLFKDDSGISASTAEMTLAILDGAIKSAANGDLDRMLDFTRGVMVNALKAFRAVEMGRQSIGLGFLPDGKPGSSKRSQIRGGTAAGCAALAVCIAWAVSSLIFCFLACFATPFCWCCYHLACLGGFAVHNFACTAIFDPLCRAQ